MSTMTVTLDHRGRLVYRGSGVKRRELSELPETKPGSGSSLPWPDLPNAMIAPGKMAALIQNRRSDRLFRELLWGNG